ncbi:hypothetical protein [Nocardia salmonicida]|jgi:hypothetical protein|uniref:hypothetical protein n=1 Tax=Nocardia salmonicida TaxID=53431 RepID=UPI0034289D12
MPEVPPLAVTAGIPKSLGEALADKIGSTSTSDQDIAGLGGEKIEFATAVEMEPRHSPRMSIDRP